MSNNHDKNAEKPAFHGNNNKERHQHHPSTPFQIASSQNASARIMHQEYHDHVCSETPAVDSFTCFSSPSSAPASWMSGKWGVGFRIPAGGSAPPIIDNLFIPHFQVQALVNQILALKVSWVIVNLSAGAFGDRYLSYHPVLYGLNPGSTPPPPPSSSTTETTTTTKSTPGQNISRSDLWGEIASALHAHGIACIAYVATQGPAMLKHGPSKAYDASIGSPSIQRWHDYVKKQYGNDDIETLKYAFADVIIQYYAKHYGKLVDGWWFDHANFGNIPLLHDTVKKYNPHTVIAFNRGRKVPLHNSNPGYEDYTFGHPTPLRRTLPSSKLNEPMVTSVEETPDGFFRGPLQELSLGHLYMPMGPTWNGGGSENCWCHFQAVDWMGRVVRAKGAWTWNINRQGNNPLDPSSSLLDLDKVTFLQKVIDDFIQEQGGGVEGGDGGEKCANCCSCSSETSYYCREHPLFASGGDTSSKPSSCDIAQELDQCADSASDNV